VIDFIMLLTLAAPLTLATVAVLSHFDKDTRPRRLLVASRVATTISLLLAIVAGIFVAFAGPATSRPIGIDPIALSLRLDSLSVIMLGLVTFVGYIVVKFSQQYLAGDKRQGIFLGRLCLTLCAVSMLVVSGSLFQLVVAWIGTSVALHGLLLFYSDRPRAVAAARKKFICARIGDVFLVLAAALLYAAFGTGDISELLNVAREMSDSGETPFPAMGAALSIVLAACFKSAQFPVHGWLTEAMETPTPVSALLHAGIVNAGGFLIVRFSDVIILNAFALYALVIVGGLTALIGSMVMLTQTNVKASLAWSTVSQMGFMLLQCGFGAFSAATLHIVAHSLYKAHAFLSSGSTVEANGVGFRSSGSLRPVGILASSLCTALILVAVGALMGLTPADKPAIIALGAILALGMMQLLARGIGGRSGDFLAARFLLTIAGLSVLYFALQLGAAQVLVGAVAEPVVPDFTLIILMGVVVSMFSAVALFHCYIPAWSAHWPELYVHLSNGFYANSLFDRLLGTWDAGRKFHH